VEPDELAALGVYDPNDQHAEARLELLQYLVGLGASTEDLVAFQDALPALAGVLTIRGGPALTLEEAAAAAGVGVEEMRALARAAGLPDPGPGVPVFAPPFVAFAAGVSAVTAVFGEEGRNQLVRVLGSAMARVADAVVSSFLVNVEPQARRQDQIGLAVARANVEATALLPLVAPALDALFRQHLLAAQRTSNTDEDLVGFETRRLVVGFVDLVGSTQLGEELTMSDLGSVLTEFEHIAADAVTAGGGRVIKLIGDEIMYTASDAASASAIALDLAETFRHHPLVPPVRAGLATGRVMLRDGDVFGSVVNLAARVVKVAHPGEVMAAFGGEAAAGLRFEPAGTHQLDGIPGEVSLHQVTRG
jgi:class 3 adenylate cyclase